MQTGNRDIVKLTQAMGLKVEKNKPIEPIHEGNETAELRQRIELVYPKEIDYKTAFGSELISNEQMYSKFDENQVKLNMEAMAKRRDKSLDIINLDEYIATLNLIKNTIQSGTKLTKSYIIGAPSSCGKTSFVIECIVSMYKLNKNIVPYITVQELGMIYRRTESYILGDDRTMRKNEDWHNIPNKSKWDDMLQRHTSEIMMQKQPMDIKSKFSWEEYINSDILFCHLTGSAAERLESEVLSMILGIRKLKCLPTIVTLETSLKSYTNKPQLYERYWQNMIATTDTLEGYGRLKHVSTFLSRSDYGL